MNFMNFKAPKKKKKKKYRGSLLLPLDFIEGKPISSENQPSSTLFNNPLPSPLDLG